ncbi:MAG: hypothetical protein AB8I08_09015 [Sandaracinaceae bacterium]
MAEWVNSLERKRVQLMERSSLRGSKRAVRVLTRMRAGTLDWRATLDAREVHRTEQRGAASTLRTLQRRLATGLDSLLLRAGEALDGERSRLSAPVEELPPVLAPDEAQAGPAPTKTHCTTAASPPKKRPAAKRARSTSQNASRATDATTLPIDRYDTLTAKQIVSLIRGLDDDQCDQVAHYERGHKARKTVLRALR